MTTDFLLIEGGALAVPAPTPDGVRVYKGIPYAAPPVGPLRWRPPQPVPPWEDVRSSSVFGPNSLQGVVFDDIDPRPVLRLFGRTARKSTCGLRPNRGVPNGSRSMVWIDGGGFVVGSGSEPRYDGTRLAARGVVVVTLNHALNALGFLAHPELTAQSERRASGKLRHARSRRGVAMGQSVISRRSAAIRTR